MEYEAARGEFRALVDQSPNDHVYQLDLAITQSMLGQLFMNLRMWDAARKELDEACHSHRRLTELFPAIAAYRMHRANALSSSGLLFMTRGLTTGTAGQLHQATTELQQAADIDRKLADEFPNVQSYQVNLGGNYCNLGILMRVQGKSTESLEWFEKAVKVLTPVHEKEPRDTNAKGFLRNSLRSRAEIYDRTGKHFEAVNDWDKVINLSPTSEQPEQRASRASSRVRAGLVVEAVAEVAELTKSLNWNASQWYDFACIYSLATSKFADKKQEYAGRAIELLTKAVKAGYKDAAHMATDTDLDPLRNRDDFKKLLVDLQKKKP